jgi:hypothetical protein
MLVFLYINFQVIIFFIRNYDFFLQLRKFLTTAIIAFLQLPITHYQLPPPTNMISISQDMI